MVGSVLSLGLVKIVEVAGDASLEGVHHDLHLLFHRLHLREDGRWRCICEGGHARIAPLRSTGLIAAPLLLGLPSFGAVPLVLLLTVMPRILRSQLFFQVKILFREAFYCGREGLNLSF